jgi:hypothetical protein
MSKNHPLIEQMRQFRGYSDDASPEQIYQNEATRMALMDPALRGAHLHSFDQEAAKHEDVTPVQRLQVHRFKERLRQADRTLRKVGR